MKLPEEINIKKENFSEWFLKFIEKGELIEDRYNIKGFYILRPWLMEIIDKIYEVWEEELKKTNHKKVLFPSLIPEENFEKEKEHVEGFKPEVFWVTEAGDTKLNTKVALRPTSETAFYSIYPLWIRSYEDLPLKLFQSCSVFRYETKATKPLIRQREFLWIEAHNAFATEEEALEQIKEDMEITTKVYEFFKIPFLFFRRPEWDKFKGAVYTFAADTILPDGKRLQLPSTHYLKQNFSKIFGIKFADRDEKEKYVYQTCYGPPISRTAAAIISIHSDDYGLILPFSFSPIQIVIIPVLKKGREEEIINYCDEVGRLLYKYKIYIDKTDKSVGSKYYNWELKGIPVRIEIGENEISKREVCIFRRDKREKSFIKFENLVEEIGKLEKEIEKNLKERVNKYFSILEADTISELKEKVLKGFVKIPFCSGENEECAEKLKEICEIAGTLYPEEEKPKNKVCIVCGNKAEIYAYACRSY
ncbi:MAG: proline--tRNA ligase [Candidatus Aenigmarchaeota archaeon ex4484_56]|nr:MAG: proline--tRNA ligase [Candidatus Aenigmarchaeota archaeon ex4484_56]